MRDLLGRPGGVEQLVEVPIARWVSGLPQGEGKGPREAPDDLLGLREAFADEKLAGSRCQVDHGKLSALDPVRVLRPPARNPRAAEPARAYGRSSPSWPHGFRLPLRLTLAPAGSLLRPLLLDETRDRRTEPRASPPLVLRQFCGRRQESSGKRG